MGTTSQASPAGLLEALQGCGGPSAARKDALLKRNMTLRLQTRGFNEMILKFSFDASQDLLEPHVSRDWEPLLRSSQCLSQAPEKSHLTVNKIILSYFLQKHLVEESDFHQTLCIPVLEVTPRFQALQWICFIYISAAVL